MSQSLLLSTMKSRGKRKRFQQNVRHNGQDWFKCDYCEKSFRRRYLLQSHIFTHTGERPFQCDQCDKKYTSYNNLKQHMKLHGKVKCYECKKCDQSFQSISALVQHESTHSDIHYHCEVCERSFPTRTFFLRHGCPFECEYCGKWFKHYMALLSHRGKEHVTVGASVELHTDSDSDDDDDDDDDDENDDDDDDDNLNDDLEDTTEQLKVFKEEKPHVCRVCGKEFNDEISLIFHIKTHGDGDPCECMVCGVTFPTEIIRTYHHMRLHTGGIDWQNIESGKKTFKQVYHVLGRNY